MYILPALAFLFLAQALLAQQPTPILPDPKLTPGDTFDVTAQDVCVPGYAKKVRAVPHWLKKQAYAEYGITQYKPGDYEVDHLIPLSLGGSNSIRNLWPQSTRTSPWNSYVKGVALFRREFCDLVEECQFRQTGRRSRALHDIMIATVRHMRRRHSISWSRPTISTVAYVLWI